MLFPRFQADILLLLNLIPRLFPNKRKQKDKIRFFFDLGMDPEAVSKVQPEALELLFKLADRLEQEPEWDGHELIGVLKAFAKENGVKMGAVMFPARVALTGLSGGPDLSSVFSLLGREETVRRIRSFSLD